jgi:hypothetical protein
VVDLAAATELALIDREERAASGNRSAAPEPN